MTPRRLILVGSAVLVAALALAIAARVVRGPLNPECGGPCAGLVVLALQWGAFALAVLGAVLAAMGLARREPPPENVQEALPPSRPR